MATTPTKDDIPSEKPVNLRFNAGKLDEEVNSNALTYNDRFDVKRLTNAGRNAAFAESQSQRESDFSASQQDKEARFQQFLLSSGYVFLGDYELGPWQFSARNQFIRYDNQYWKLAATAPDDFATTGITMSSFEIDKLSLVLIDGDTLRQELSASDGSMLGYKSNASGALHYSVAGRLNTKLKLFDFIPETKHEAIVNYTSTEDLSSYVQAAIDSANTMGGATIYCPAGQYYLNVKTKPNVILTGARGPSVRRAMPWTYSASATPGSTRFRNFANDWIISSATASQSDVTSRSFGIVGIDFDAKDATNSTGGVRLRGADFCVKSCSFYGFQDQGLEASGNIGLIEDVIANNCLLNRVRSDYVGTVEVSGAADCQIHRVEGNAQVVGLGNITNAEPYICGIKIAGNNHYVSGLMGEISETGIYLAASSIHHKVSDCRADNNTGPGYLLSGVMLVNSHSYNNSRAGGGLYSAFAAINAATRLMLSNCLAWTDSAPVDGTGQQRMHKYGYDISVVDYTSLRLKPWINQCYSYGHSVSWVNEPPTYGMQYTPYIGLLRVVDNTTTAPNVDGISVVMITTTSLSEITGLSGGVTGQTVDVYLNATATVTLRNSANFLVNNFATNNDKVMVRGRVYKFIKTAANGWREVGDAPRTYSGTTAERPNSAAVVGMQYFDTTLNKPIWRNAANTRWVDASGISV